MKMDKFSTPLAYSSSGSLMFLGVGVSDWAVIVGMVCAAVTAGVNWYYRRAERLDRLSGKARTRQEDHAD